MISLGKGKRNFFLKLLTLITKDKVFLIFYDRNRPAYEHSAVLASRHFSNQKFSSPSKCRIVVMRVILE